MATGEHFLVDRSPELLGHGIDIADVEVDERVRARITRVHGQAG